MKFSTLIFFAQSLICQGLVKLTDINDKTYNGAQLNSCFKLPLDKIYEISVLSGYKLQIYSSEKCTEGLIYEFEGTFTVNGFNEGWRSAVVPRDFTKDEKPSDYKLNPISVEQDNQI